MGWVQKSGIIIFLIFAISGLTAGATGPFDQGESSGQNLLGLLVSDASDDQVLSWNQELLELTSKFASKKTRVKDPHFFLEGLFYRVHHKYLKNYSQYSSLTSLMENGNYDCVSGTALYAHLLGQLGFAYHIFETEYHIYLLVETKDGSVLIESTDPATGFVNLPRKIDERIRIYKSDGQGRHQGEIGLVELAGLQYYNLAIDAYNNHQPYEALKFLEEGLELYPSHRLFDFQAVIYEAIGVSAKLQK